MVGRLHILEKRIRKSMHLHAIQQIIGHNIMCELSKVGGPHFTEDTLKVM